MEMIRIHSVDALTPKVIEKLIEQHELTEVPRFKKLQKYYEAKNPEINGRTFSDPQKPNNKPAHSFGRYIVDTMAGYFLGVPVSYNSPDENFKEKLQDIYNANNEASINTLHAKQMGIKGRSAELLWIDEASQVRISFVDVDHLIPIYDYSIEPQLLACIRYYTIKDYATNKDTLQVELYTKDTIQYYSKGKRGLVLQDEQEHYFGDVPINLYYNNEEELGDFEPVLDLIDLYDLAQADSANEFSYYSDSYLVLKGLPGTTAEDLQNMKENRIMVLDEGGDAEFLVKQADTTSIEAYKTRLENDIHKFSGVPNLSTIDFGGAVSGTALKFRFFQTETIVAGKERLFKESLMRRAKMLTQILNMKGNQFTHVDLEVNFVRNLPINLTESVEMVKNLYGVVSEETLLAQLPFIENPKQELEKKKAEMEMGSDDYSNLGNIE